MFVPDDKRLPLTSVNATEEMGEVVKTLPTGLELVLDTANELLLAASVGEATSILTMPKQGGELTEIGTIGYDSVDAGAMDENNVYLDAGLGLVRMARP